MSQPSWHDRKRFCLQFYFTTLRNLFACELLENFCVLLFSRRLLLCKVIDFRSLFLKINWKSSWRHDQAQVLCSAMLLSYLWMLCYWTLRIHSFQIKFAKICEMNGPCAPWARILHLLLPRRRQSLPRCQLTSIMFNVVAFWSSVYWLLCKLKHILCYCTNKCFSILQRYCNLQFEFLSRSNCYFSSSYRWVLLFVDSCRFLLSRASQSVISSLRQPLFIFSV